MPDISKNPRNAHFRDIRDTRRNFEGDQRQQYTVVYDPTESSGDPANNFATLVEGYLLPVTGIDSYGLAVWDDPSSTWQQILFIPPTLPMPFPSTTIFTPTLPTNEDRGLIAGQLLRVNTSNADARLILPYIYPAGLPQQVVGVRLLVAGGNKCRIFPAFTGAKTLSSFPAFGDVTLHLTDVSGMDTAGVIELIPTVGEFQFLHYTGISGTDLTGVTGWQDPGFGWTGPALACDFTTQAFETASGAQEIDLTADGETAIFADILAQGVWARLI